MKNSILTIALLCFSAFIPSVLHAQQTAHINYQEIIQSLPEYIEANNKYEIYKQSWQDVLKELESKYQQTQAKFEKEKAAPAPNQYKLNLYSKDMESILNRYQLTELEIQDSLNAYMMELVEPIKKRVADIVEAVAKEKGYTHVIDNSSGILIYADPAHDISDAVKAKLGITDKPTSNSAAGKPKKPGTTTMPGGSGVGGR